MEDRPRKEDRARTTALILGYPQSERSLRKQITGSANNACKSTRMPLRASSETSNRARKICLGANEPSERSIQDEVQVFANLSSIASCAKKRRYQLREQPCNLIDFPCLSNAVIMLSMIL